MPAHLRSFRVPVAKIHSLRQRFEPSLRAQTEFLDLPEARSRLLLHLARGRALVLRSWSGLRKSTSQVRSRKTRPLRMQRSSLLGLGPAEGEAPRPPQTARIAGVGARAGGHRARCLRACAAQRGRPHPYPRPARAGGRGRRADHRAARRGRPARRARRRARAQAAPSQGEPRRAPLQRLPSRHWATRRLPCRLPRRWCRRRSGEAEVPNGRVFTLRMNGHGRAGRRRSAPQRHHGASARSARARSRQSDRHLAQRRRARDDLNRGGYAELTIDFQPASPRATRCAEETTPSK